MPDGTIIVGKLKDDELRKSIDSLVKYVDESATKMKQSFDTNLKGIEDLFKNFGNLSNIATQASTQGTDKRVANANKEVQANNAVVQSYDALATALNKSGGKMSILEQYDMQIAILKEDLIALRERLAEYNNALNSGDFNKQTWGREQIELANKEAERLMSTIATLESQRGNLANLLNPQGDAFKNFVDDLTKANPELAMLNQQFKEGKALLQDQKTQISQTTQELKIYKADAESLARTEQIKAEAQRKIYEESINAGRKAQEQLRQYQHAMEQVVQSSKGGVITFADAETAMMHYTKLRQILNALTTAYYQMNDAQRQSAEGVALKQDIDMLQRAVPKIYALAESMRPLKDQIAGVESEITKLNVLFKMMSQSEKESARGQELQDKIQRLQNYLKSLEEQTEKTSDANQKYTSSQKKVEDSNEKVIRSNSRLEKSFDYIQRRLTYLISVYGSMNFVKQIISVRAEFETMERSLGVLVDNAERGAEMFRELNAMALNSPFTTMELGQAARQLLAYGVAEKDLVDTTRRLADVSAAVGTPIERIAYALGQVQAYGYLTSLQARSFMRSGIPLIKELAQLYTDLEGHAVTTADVYDRMKKKAVSYDDVLKVIMRDTDQGGRFFDYQAKMADTLKVRLANLTLAFQNMLNEIGKSQGGTISFFINGLRKLIENWKSLSRIITSLIISFGAFKAIQAAALPIMVGLGKASFSQMRAFALMKTNISGATTSLKNFLTWGQTWAFVGVAIITDLIVSLVNASNRIDEINEKIKENAKNRVEEVGNIIDKYNGLIYTLDKETGQKTYSLPKSKEDETWEQLQQDILLASSASDVFLSKLESIDNMQQRIQQGMTYLNDIQEAAKVVEAMGDIDVNQDVWHGIFGEGFASDIKDYTKALKDYYEQLRNDENTKDITADQIEGYKEAMSEAKKLAITINDEFNKIPDSAQFSAEKTVEIFSQVIQSINAEEFKTDKERVVAQRTTMEEIKNLRIQAIDEQLKYVSGAEKQALLEEKANISRAFDARKVSLSNYLDWASKVNSQAFTEMSQDAVRSMAFTASKSEEFLTKHLESFRKQFPLLGDDIDNVIAQGKASFGTFYDWLEANHSDALNGMTREQFEAMDWSSDRGRELLDKWLDQFKGNNLKAYNDLKNYVDMMNQFVVNIMVKFNIEETDYGKDLQSRFKAIAGDSFSLDVKNAKDLSEGLKEVKKRRDELTESLKDYNGQLTVEEQIQRNNKNAELVGLEKILAYYEVLSKGQQKEAKAAQKAANDAQKAREKAQRAAEKAAREAAEQQRKEEEAVKKALSDEVHVIENVRKAWEELRKAGKTSEDSAQSVYEIYNDMVNDINSVLGKYGIDELSVFDIIDPGTKDLKSLQSIYYYLNNQLTQLEKSGKVTRDAIKTISDELKKLYKDIAIDAMEQIEYNFDQSMNKLNEGYEMSVTLEDSPELSELFADMLGVDMGEVLKDAPRTLREYTRQVNEITAAAINAWAHENGMKEVFTLPKNFSILDKKFWDDFTAKMGKEGIQSPFYKAVEKVRDDLLKSIQKDYTDTTKQWESLVDKYGEIQARIVKLTRDSLSEQVSIIKKFAPEKEIQALDLVRSIRLSNDSGQIASLRKQFEELLTQAIEYHPEAEKIVNASMQKLNENIAKAIWDDFKGQPLYSTLFDDLGRASTESINRLKGEMDGLKNKIKESPESMKALMSAYQKLREELIKRDPFGQMVDSMERYHQSIKDVIIAEQNLENAKREEAEAQEQLENAQNATPKSLKEILKLTSNYAKKIKARKDAEADLLQEQNKQQEAQVDFNKSIDEANSHISKLANAIKGVGSAIGESGGEVINLIGDIMDFAVTCSEAIKFTSTTTSTAIKAIERASVILTIISAAIQLAQKVSSLLPTSDSQYEKAAKKKAEINMLADAVRDYRLAVLQAKAEEDNWFGTSSLKQLKNFYEVGSEAMKSYYEKMNEEQAIYQNKSGAGWLTTIAHYTNPAYLIGKALGIDEKDLEPLYAFAETQLYITERLNKDGKGIQEYAEGYVRAIDNLRIETRKASKGFLGSGIGGKSQKTENLITWVKDKLGLDLFDPETGLLNLEAYEQLMDKYENKLVGQTKETLESLAKYAEEWNNYIDKLHEYVDQMYSPLVDNMVDAMWEWYDNGTNALDNFREYASDTFRNIVGDMMKTIILSNFAEEYAEDIKKMYEKYSAGEMNEEALLRGVASRTGQMMDAYESNIPILENLMMTATDVLRQHGIDLAQGNTELSALQQGIQGITETTANALEAYMNGVSQQVYYQSDLLTQIRDAIILYDFSLQSSINAEILLSLQQSYQVQMAIQTVLTGWSSPDGLSVRVEMI